MYRQKYQKGYLSIFYSCGKTPLESWGTHVRNGWIRRVTDDDINSLALDVGGTNVTTTYIYVPKDKKMVLAIAHPFITMLLKNMKKYITFEITILDDRGMHRRFRFSNFQRKTSVRPFSTSIPLVLKGGWNQLQFNLASFTRKAYGSKYLETTRMQIHANCRLRRIYFSDRIYTENELPEEFKIQPYRRSRMSERKSGSIRSKASLTSNKSGQISNGKLSVVDEDEQAQISKIPSLEIHIPKAEYEEPSDERVSDDEGDKEEEEDEESDSLKETVEKTFDEEVKEEDLHDKSIETINDEDEEEKVMENDEENEEELRQQSNESIESENDKEKSEKFSSGNEDNDGYYEENYSNKEIIHKYVENLVDQSISNI